MKPLLISLALAISVASCDRRPDPHAGRGVITQIGAFEIALNAFREDCGRYPAMTEGLTALVKCPAGISQSIWKGPYLDSDTIPSDSWGHAYVYRYPSAHGTNRVDLYSLGSDGVSRTGGDDADDINNWRKR